MTKPFDMSQFPAAGQFVIVHGAQPVGVLLPAAGHTEPLKGALGAAGYEVKEPGEVVDLAAECHTENPRPCDISVSVGYARDLARETGVPTPELDQLLRDGYRDEGEVRGALEKMRDRLTGSHRQEAEEVIGFLWPGGAAAPQVR